MAQRRLIEAARDRDFTAEQVSQQLQVKPLDCRQDCQLKFQILGQETLPREILPRDGGIL